MDDGSVVTLWGVPLLVVREDAHYYYYYKVFRTSLPLSRSPRADGERARVEESYRVSTRSSARLRFRSFGDGLPTSGQWRNAFAVADMNGDGHADIVHGLPRKRPGPPRIFLGDGKGSWRAWDEVRFPAMNYNYGGVAAGDLDGDGIRNLALGMHLSGMAAFVGDGHGRFRDASEGLDAPQRDGAPADFSSQALAILDWDRDGDADILALGEGPRPELAPGDPRARPHQGARGLVLYRGDGTGRWKRSQTETDTSQIFGQSLAAGDLDADGHTDAVAGSNVLGRTDILFFGTRAGRWRNERLLQLRPQAYIRAVAIEDLDSDGRDDLAVAYTSFELSTWRTGIDLFFSRSPRRWTRKPLAVQRGRAGIHAMATGDLDGDGWRDLVALIGNGDTWVFPGDGHGFLTRERNTVPHFPGRCRGAHVELADRNGDQRDEIMASFAEEPSTPSGQDRCKTGGGIMAWTVESR